MNASRSTGSPSTETQHPYGGLRGPGLTITCTPGYLVGKTQGYLTGRVDNLDALKEQAEDAFLKLQYECGAEQTRMWRPKNLRAFEVEAEINNKMDEVWLGKKQLDKAHMADLKKSVDAILAKGDLS